jgi:ABC-type Fe3+-hydroxamate transport system substrate-binding protein
MKKIIFTIMSLCFLFIAACGNASIEEPITLSNQEGEEVTFPTGKPVLFFFMTTYT